MSFIAICKIRTIPITPTTNKITKILRYLLGIIVKTPITGNNYYKPPDINIPVPLIIPTIVLKAFTL